eukprot:6485331-Pyramimonas_sp.AAC.1
MHIHVHRSTLYPGDLRGSAHNFFRVAIIAAERKRTPPPYRRRRLPRSEGGGEREEGGAEGGCRRVTSMPHSLALLKPYLEGSST